MEQQELKEFLKEHRASIGVQLYGNMCNGLWVSGVYSEREYWLVVSHCPDITLDKRYITHVETCRDIDSIFERSDGLAAEVEASPQKYMSKKE